MFINCNSGQSSTFEIAPVTTNVALRTIFSSVVAATEAENKFIANRHIYIDDIAQFVKHNRIY